MRVTDSLCVLLIHNVVTIHDHVVEGWICLTSRSGAAALEVLKAICDMESLSPTSRWTTSSSVFTLYRSPQTPTVTALSSGARQRRPARHDSLTTLFCDFSIPLEPFPALGVQLHPWLIVFICVRNVVMSVVSEHEWLARSGSGSTRVSHSTAQLRLIHPRVQFRSRYSVVNRQWMRTKEHGLALSLTNCAQLTMFFCPFSATQPESLYLQIFLYTSTLCLLLGNHLQCI